MADREELLPTAPVEADRLSALPDPVWRRLVPHLRRALVDLPEEQRTPRLRRLAAVPAKRLASGRTRRDVATVLAEGGTLWLDLRRRVLADEPLARDVAAALVAPPTPAPDAAPPPAEDVADDRVARLRDRARTLQAERDDARRRAEGEAARADREAAARQKLEAEVAELRERVAGLESAARDADEQRRAAVDRERRRSRTELAEAREELRAMRRAQAEEARRVRAADEARAADQERRAAASAAAAEPAPPPRLVPGRPSRLPERVRADTTEAADLLLHAGRLVLVDGYNVTRTHQPSLDLEGQRRWLTNLLASAVATRRIEPVLVFDGHGTTGAGSGRRDRGVVVAFTPEGITADDDIVFRAEAEDPGRAIVVVTDDRELRERLSLHRVDLLGTTAFLGALR